VDPRGCRGREGGGVPLDLMLVLALIAALVAAGAWFTVQTGGLQWLLIAASGALALFFVTRPTRRRRRVDADGRRRRVGHDGSWTSGREEEK
jgi:membrane protein implicated in regulation of membrane protease activity